MKVVSTLLVLSSLALWGCPSGQSAEEALHEMCNLPDAIKSDPSAIGPYLGDRVTNSEIVRLLETLASAQDLYSALSEHGIDPESCDLVTALGSPQDQGSRD